MKTALFSTTIRAGVAWGLSRRFRRGFTLVELMSVMGIAALLLGLAVPAFISLEGGADLTQAAYSIADGLGQARAYAMANKTYVFVGIVEVDATVDSSARPQVTGGPTSYGRLAMAIVASKDGTQGYNVSADLANPAWTSYSNGDNLVAVRPVQRFEGVHLAATSETVPNQGNTTRPSVTDAAPIAGGTSYVIGNSACQSVTPFSWPLGSALDATSSQYYFAKVINFDPQGVARIQDPVNNTSIAPYMEIGLQQAHGHVVSNGPNVVAIQIDGVTGATRIYRP